MKELINYVFIKGGLTVYFCFLLQRNLKIMIDSGDSANREKDTRFQRIKNEVVEMLKTQVPLMESQVLSLKLN